MANRGKFYYKGSDINDLIKTDPSAQEDASYVGLPDILSTNYNLYKRNGGIGYQINGTDLGIRESSGYEYKLCNFKQTVAVPNAANKVRVIGVGGGGVGGGGGAGMSANRKNAGNRKAHAGWGGSGTAATWGYADKNRSGNTIEIEIGVYGNGGTGHNQYSMNSNWNNKNRKGPDGSPGNAGTPSSFKFGNHATYYFNGGAGGAGGGGANGHAKYKSVSANRGADANNGSRNTNLDDTQHSGNTDPGKAGDGGDGGPNGHDGQPGKRGQNGQAIVVFLTD